MARSDAVKTEERSSKKRKHDSGDESDEPLSARFVGDNSGSLANSEQIVDACFSVGGLDSKIEENVKGFIIEYYCLNVYDYGLF